MTPGSRCGASMSMCCALAAVSLLACAGERARPASSAELAGCAPGSYGELGTDECWRDRDCVLCADGTACGVAMSRSHRQALGSSCAVPPGEGSVCDASGVACCQHRCVSLLGPPIFGRGPDETGDVPSAISREDER